VSVLSDYKGIAISERWTWRGRDDLEMLKVQYVIDASGWRVFDPKIGLT
jgi:hypothetical protein